MSRLDKKLVDEVIRATEGYFKTGDEDYLPALMKAQKVLGNSSSWEVVHLVFHLAQYKHASGNGTYDDIYKALAVFGIIVEG